MIGVYPQIWFPDFWAWFFGRRRLRSCRNVEPSFLFAHEEWMPECDLDYGTLWHPPIFLLIFNFEFSTRSSGRLFLRFYTHPYGTFQELKSDLCSYIPCFEKNTDYYHSHLKTKTADAIRNSARQISQANMEHQFEVFVPGNPGTEVTEIVQTFLTWIETPQGWNQSGFQTVCLYIIDLWKSIVQLNH